MTHTIEIDESQRQLILLALAELSRSRPGWHYVLGVVAGQFPGGVEMYEKFREINADLNPKASDK